jgi:holo-[acyl-carrier protein] synthase
VIVGFGVDVCDARRMARELAREAGGFRDQVFTPGEIAYCATRPCPSRHFAARFAAKEAALKALRTGMPDSGALREVEVRFGRFGAPQLRFLGRMARVAQARGVRHVHLTLAHDGCYALAGVMLESGDGD